MRATCWVSRCGASRLYDPVGPEGRTSRPGREGRPFGRSTRPGPRTSISSGRSASPACESRRGRGRQRSAGSGVRFRPGGHPSPTRTPVEMDDPRGSLAAAVASTHSRTVPLLFTPRVRIIRGDRGPAPGAGAVPKPSHRANRRWRWPAYHACRARSRVRLALVPSIAPPLPLSSPALADALAGGRPRRSTPSGLPLAVLSRAGVLALGLPIRG